LTIICHKTLTLQRVNRCEIAHVLARNLQKITGEITLKKCDVLARQSYIQSRHSCMLRTLLKT
jgi:hypothetical protein